MSEIIPSDDERRKMAPMFRGLLAYFPAALFEVAAHSMKSDMKHNGDNPNGPQWTRGLSADHADCIVRHLVDSMGSDRMYHLTAVAWRALALLQESCEEEMDLSAGSASVFTSPSSPHTQRSPDPPRIGGHEAPA